MAIVKNILCVIVMLAVTAGMVWVSPQMKESKKPFTTPYWHEIEQLNKKFDNKTLSEAEHKRLFELIDLENAYYRENVHKIPSRNEFWELKRPVSLVLIFIAWFAVVVVIRQYARFSYGELIFILIPIAIGHIRVIPMLEIVCIVIAVIIAGHIKGCCQNNFVN